MLVREDDMKTEEVMYGLFHVNAATGEAVRFDGDEVLTRCKAEERASDCRVGQGRGSAHFNGWLTEARPLTA